VAEIYYDLGRIVRLIFDFEPVVVEEAGNPLYETEETNDDLTYELEKSIIATAGSLATTIGNNKPVVL